jgi:DNA-binding NarL/FixJ family response regulator
MHQTRVLIVDDHPLFRQGLAWVLRAEPDFTVVGEAASGEAALERALALRPDVVVCDVQLPDANGIEVARHEASASSTSGQSDGQPSPRACSASSSE